MAGKTESTKVGQKNRLITRSITTTRPVDMTLNLDCVDEPLSEAQLTYLGKSKENYDKVQAKIDEMIKDHNAQLIAQSGPVSAYQYSLIQAAQANIMKTTHMMNQNQQKNQQITLNVLNNSTVQQGNLQLVMDPRKGVILSNTSQNTINNMQNQSKNVLISPADSNSFSRPTRQSTPRNKVLQVHQPEIIEEPILSPAAPAVRVRAKPPMSTPPSGPPPQKAKQQMRQQPSSLSSAVAAAVAAAAQQHQQQPPSSSQVQVAPASSSIKINNRPTEQTSIGGIAIGVKSSINEAIEEAKKNQPDGREIAFNKVNGGRTYPSLVVVARPGLHSKEISPSIASKERAELDAKVKNVLMFSSTRFAEWLIQQGLVKSEQYCNQHSGYQPKLKLGMYNDAGTFPYSGGYVWVSSCCEDRFVSVFSGSIFQGSPHLPTVLLKLIYHWSCQTNVQNVISWVKVSNVYVKNFFTNLRSICTAAIWDKSKLIGGKGRSIQVGVISLGTTSQDGNLRQVKVEVLGILNTETGQIRLRACDPVPEGDKTYRRRFNHILQPLKDWVHKDSKILTDYTVDKATLNELGFNQVTQIAYGDQSARNARSNFGIMDYLRKIVPRMFQNTLSLLNRQMIQQFLDELVWRETFGVTSSRAFQSIITHIAEQTRASVSENLLDRLAKISANPFYDWSYSKNSSTTKDSSSHNEHQQQQQQQMLPVKQTVSSTSSAAAAFLSGNKRSRKRTATNISTTASPEPETKRTKSPDLNYNNPNDQTSLFKFYYAISEGDKATTSKNEKRNVNFTCFLCSFVMKSNTEVMEHMIRHVPPRVPGQPDIHVCRYCCAAFSSKHQMVIHVTEAHSTFGNGDGDMVVCGICEHKFANSNLLVEHMSTTHIPSEMPYRCDCCGYRTSSHKDVIDHFYKVHEKGEYLQCPYCLKLMHYYIDNGSPISSNIHSYLVHMQRHIVRREKEHGGGNKCSRCCLWFNQTSSLKTHKRELHHVCDAPKITPPLINDKNIMISKSRHSLRAFMEMDYSTTELPNDLNRWPNGPITVNARHLNLRCQECEEDIDEPEHYPGEQKCEQCRYVTCCWRAFKEHQQQVHNERPMTSLVVPSPLINIPLERKMHCGCGFSTKDGNLLANHFVKCSIGKILKASGEKRGSSGMLDSLGLVPKTY
ncbi:hypothetical protein HCN44_005752 [Aphidius gifuensis]|uniref:C2H2-type domain-containing protein n=1 Tax=Aphidius gifuensis TaxID=684658 RepID=A0A834XY47_APHGI|nr:uncharacterized protein LOC122852783 [Aphidius gifuensis]KAF7992971.1 hypothetical protein HCN44_005752 [Aphidius gifuensis]